MPECLDMILQVSKETGEAAGTIQEEASAILEEMAHRLQLSTVRFFAFALTKAFKSLFRSINVNEEGIQRVSIHTYIQNIYESTTFNLPIK